ncbi:ABC transporter permease [Microbacterium sp. A93]|uniref:ABC transporter permease n=1 Tax=unclassified Microbacterium TaxID=2609290 RepID=UPI003F424BAA
MSDTKAIETAIRPTSRRDSPWLWGGIGVVGFIAVWALIAAVLDTSGGRISKLAGPLQVVQALVEYAQKSLLTDLASSLGVFIGGWALGAAAAVLTGLLLGRITLLGRMFLPVIEMIRPVSSIAWIPLAIVWFGFGYSGKLFLVGLAVYLVVIVYAVDGASRIPSTLEKSATMLGMGTWQKMRFLVLPSMMSEVLIGLRVALTAGWGTVIIAELIAADSGLGKSLVRAQQGYDIPTVMALMLCFGAVGLILNGLYSLALKGAQRWKNA